MVQIAPQMHRPVGIEIGTGAVVEFFCTANVSIAKMMQRHGHLNQALVKSATRTPIFGPKFFPDIVRFKKLALIEEFNAGPVVRQGVD